MEEEVDSGFCELEAMCPAHACQVNAGCQDLAMAVKSLNHRTPEQFGLEKPSETQQVQPLRQHCQGHH